MMLLGFAGIAFMPIVGSWSQHWWLPDPRSSGL